MKLNDLFAYRSIFGNKKVLHAFARHSATIFKSKNIMLLFKDFRKAISLKQPTLFYHITDTTLKRIAGIEIKEIDGPKLMGSLKGKLTETGIVFFNDGLHFAYTWSGTYLTILVCRKDISNKTDMEAYTASLRKVLIGSFHIDFNTEEITPSVYSPMDLLFNHSNYQIRFFEKDELQVLRHLLKELNIQDAASTAGLTVEAIERTSTGRVYMQAYQEKWDDLKTALQAFLFIKLAKTIDTTRISDSDGQGSQWIPKDKIMNIIRVDTTYDENIQVINPFSVQGHFRNQPCGKGYTDTRLVYIDSYMKTGYTRPSKIEPHPENTANSPNSQ